MIVESSQLLSFASYINNLSTPYKVNKKNWLSHPCTIWTAENKSNAEWLLNHLKYLIIEYNKRWNTNKIHKCNENIELFEFNITKFKNESLTPFINCTKNYKHIDNIFEAYKLELKKTLSL